MDRVVSKINLFTPRGFYHHEPKRSSDEASDHLISQVSSSTTALLGVMGNVDLCDMP